MSPLPAHWIDVPLGTFISAINAGASFKCEERPPRGDEVGVVKVSAVTWGTYDEEESKTCIDAARVDADLMVGPGDFLISRANTIQLVGACVIVLRVTKRVMLSDKILRLRLREIEPRWLLHYLRTTDGRAQIERLATGNQESMRNIGQDRLRAISLPVAPRAEQDRVVAVIEQHLSDIDAGVAGLKRVLANLKRYRASVLKAACEGRLVPTEDEVARRESRDYEPGDALLERIILERSARFDAGQRSKVQVRKEPPKAPQRRGTYEKLSAPDVTGLPQLPAGWIWAALSQLTDIQGGIQKQPSRSPRTNRFPFLRVANVARGRLDLLEIHEVELFHGELERLRLQTGDLLVVEGNGSGSEIGRMAIWDGSIANCVHQNHLIRARPHQGGVVPRFLEAAWNSPTGTKQVTGVASSTSGLFTLSVSKISRLPIPLPPLAEQHRIVAEVDRLLSVADATEKAVRAQLARAGRLRQSVLKRAFEGKLVPQDPTDEPASALLARIHAERQATEPVKRRRRGGGGGQS